MPNDNDQLRPHEPSGSPTLPPDIFIRPETGRLALLSYLGPILVLCAIVGVALIYWVNREPGTARSRADHDVIGTSGQSSQGAVVSGQPADGTRDGIETGETAGAPGSTDLSALTTIARILASGPVARREVRLSGVGVDRVDGRTIWVRDGVSQIAVRLPDETAAPTQGNRVDVSGRTEAHDESIRIIADAIHPTVR